MCTLVIKHIWQPMTKHNYKHSIALSKCGTASIKSVQGKWLTVVHWATEKTKCLSCHNSNTVSWSRLSIWSIKPPQIMFLVVYDNDNVSTITIWLLCLCPYTFHFSFVFLLYGRLCDCKAKARHSHFRIGKTTQLKDKEQLRE